MRTLSFSATAVAFLFLSPSAALSQGIPQNYGDFLGTNVDFKQVTEQTQTAGDADQLWFQPSLAGGGDQLQFFPPAFISSCNPFSLSDSTTSTLTTTIEAHPGGHVDNIWLVENGDVQLIHSPPFGTNGTNVSASLSGTVTVLEVDGLPYVPPLPGDEIIPFTGTYSPSPTFQLPDNFGISTWKGTVAVDVAGEIPLATKVVLSLDNTLAANCIPANNSAKIQKKVVSGPGVAIMVNPIECDVLLDKTCCVPQPVLPDLDICEGDVVRMQLEYTGDKCSASDNEQGKKFRCYGRREVGEPADIYISGWNPTVTATPSTGINIGDVVEFTDSSGTLPGRTKFKVKDDWHRRQYLKMDTSCERALECGDQFGAFKLVGLETTLGGYVDCSAPPPDPVCGMSGDPAGTPCDAKLVDMVLEYNGQPCQDPLGNPQNGEARCDGDATGRSNVGILYAGKHGYRQQISPASNINDGDQIRVTATWHGGLFPNQEYLITDGSGIVQEVDFHVSCSQPLALGDEFGSLKLVEFTTKDGTHVALGDGTDGTQDQCEVPLAPPKPHCTDDLESVTLVYIGDYLGEGCTVSNSQGGYAVCGGVPDPGALVEVGVATGLVAEPTEMIEFGDLVTIENASGGNLPWLVTLAAQDEGGSAAQLIRFKTSCHKPLSLGDRFGSWVVFGMDRETDGPISLGGTVQYQYNVTNPNVDPLENVIVTDSELGEIVNGATIPAGQTITYTETATLYGTTTNVAEATGDIGGDFCAPGADQVTVDVFVPPDGAFSCSCQQSLKEISVTWNGAQTIRVLAWNGDVNQANKLALTGPIAPGDTITVDGFTKNYSVWEIMDEVGTTKLGESIFHLTCRDRFMNGFADCGKPAGNGRFNDPSKINDWILAGMVDDDETMSCSATSVPPPPVCGFGPELMVVLGGLMVWHRRRLVRR